jgi:hypothetical protein
MAIFLAPIVIGQDSKLWTVIHLVIVITVLDVGALTEKVTKLKDIRKLMGDMSETKTLTSSMPHSKKRSKVRE